MEDYSNQMEKSGVIYRNLTLPNTGRAALGKLMQALLSVNGQTTCQSQIGTWSVNQQGRGSTFFRLRFRSVEHLDRFHALGYDTTRIEKVNPLLPGDD